MAPTPTDKKPVSFLYRGPNGFLVVPADLRTSVRVVGRAPVDVIELEEWWIEVAVDSQWTAAYRMLQQGGYPVIAEVRVFPREVGNRHAGEWSGVYLGKNATVPAGGISARLLKRLRPGDTQGSDIAQGRDAWMRFMNLTGTKTHFSRAGFRNLKKRRRDSGSRDSELLEAAVFYVEQGGRTPVAALARARGISRSQARDLLQAARRKGFLTPGLRGKKSRTLTDHAKRLLAKKEKK